MAVHGQRFELDLDSDNWKFDIKENEDRASPLNVVREIQERDSSNVPAAPTLKSSKTGFPEHRKRRVQSAFKQQQQSSRQTFPSKPNVHEPSDRAILHHVAGKQGIDLASTKEKADIDAENRNRLNNMSLEELENARAELMAQFDPEKLRALLQRSNIDDEHEKQQKQWADHEAARPPQDSIKKSVAFAEPASEDPSLPSIHPNVADEDDREKEMAAEEDDVNILAPPPSSTMHFPAPPRNKSDYKPLDPDSQSFLKDLRENYFPDLPHDPQALSWLTDPTLSEREASSYNPSRTGFAPSSLRFGFNGNLIPPTESLEIDVKKGLHHHGDAPDSAGYTIPELTLLSRSTLANQRCVAYQVVGRILYRLGRGDFGPRGSELCEGLWTCIEKERVVEVIMGEANRDKGHMSAKSYATEALWLWRRGGGGDRGVLKEGETRAI